MIINFSQFSSGLTMDSNDFAMAQDPMKAMESAKRLGEMLDHFAPDTRLTTDSNQVSTGGAFTTGELEKPDFNLNEPLTSVTWPRDIPVETGGGFVDFTSNFFVDYGTAGANQYGLMGVDTDVLPTIQANVTKDVYKVNRMGYIVRVPLVSQARLQMANRSLEDMLQNGLRLNYDKALDQNGYLGFDIIGSKGVVNQSTELVTNPTDFIAAGLSVSDKVILMYSPANGAGASRQWKNKTPDQILVDFNNLLTAAWANAQYDISGMPNHVLMPPALFSQLNTRLISTAGSQSILSYLEDNNIAKANGVDLKIVACRQTNTAGTDLESGTSSGRIVAYRNDKSRLQFDETVPLTRMLTQPSVEQMAYLSAYVASVGVLKIKYFQTIAYLDGAIENA